nr:MAG TPA: hypothetical protein [Caudoviricetes sp.]
MTATAKKLTHWCHIVTAKRHRVTKNKSKSKR